MMNLTVIKNRANATTPGLVWERRVCDQLLPAQTFVTRMVGLLGTDRLDARAGLWIKPSNGVHTFGMKYAIDIVALDEKHRVVKVWKNVAPRRLVFAPRGTRSILELAAGTIAFHGLCEGDTCRMSETMLAEVVPAMRLAVAMAN